MNNYLDIGPEHIEHDYKVGDILSIGTKLAMITKLFIDGGRSDCFDYFYLTWIVGDDYFNDKIMDKLYRNTIEKEFKLL